MASAQGDLAARPRSGGRRVGRWRIVDLCQVVEDRWGVTHSETGMLRLLWSLDLLHRKTRPGHPQANARAQEVFKKIL